MQQFGGKVVTCLIYFNDVLDSRREVLGER